MPITTTQTSLTPPLKWHGGKHYLAKKIIRLMTPHVHYVEPFGGGLAVLLARDPDDKSLWLPPHNGVSEVVNDRHGQLMNFWRVLQNPDTFERFQRQAEAIPLARPAWETAREYLAQTYVADAVDHDTVAQAVAFFVHCRQSRSGAMRSFTPLTRTRTRRQMNGNVSEWLGAVEGLPSVHARLRRVVIENLPALDVIRREDTPGTLFYCDPPYLHTTRSAPEVYAHEMTEQDHQALLTVLWQCQGKVMLCGYPSALYTKPWLLGICTGSTSPNTLPVRNQKDGKQRFYGATAESTVSSVQEVCRFASLAFLVPSQARLRKIVSALDGCTQKLTECRLLLGEVRSFSRTSHFAILEALTKPREKPELPRVYGNKRGFCQSFL